MNYPTAGNSGPPGQGSNHAAPPSAGRAHPSQRSNTVRKYGKKEAGTGEHLTHFNNKIKNTNEKRQPLTDDCLHTKHKLKFQAWSSLLFHCRGQAVHQRCPVPSHGTASEPLSWLRTERQCVREPDRDFFFLSPLSLLCHSSSFHLLFSRLICPYPQVRCGRLDGLPLGEGGSRAQSRRYPPACKGRWGYVASGAGPRAVGTERGRWSKW